MSARRNRDLPEGPQPGEDSDSGLLLGENIPVPDLPGLFTKRMVLGTDEAGFLTSRGNVVSELKSGTNKVGRSFLGWGAGDRAVVRLHNRPFRLRLHFSEMLSKGYETLDAIVHVTASLSVPSLFYSTVMRGRDRLYAPQLGSTVAASMDDLVQVKVAETDGQALRHDPPTQRRLMDELQPHVKRVMEERGLRLESVDLLAFQNPGESEELLDELEEAERLIAQNIKPGREDMQRVLTRLRNAGLATPEMAERAQLLFDGGTPNAFFNVLKDISRASRRRLEAQVADRSERLSEKVNDKSGSTSFGSVRTREMVLSLVGPAWFIFGLVYKAVSHSVQGWYVLAAGVAMGVAFLVIHVFVRARRLVGEEKGDQVVIRLDRWVKRNSMETDNLIRRQMGREFANSLSDVKDAKLAAFRQEKRAVADSLNDLENRMDLMRTEVESAPAASTIVSVKRFPTRRIRRMVRFEEDLLRQARNLSIRSGTAKASLAGEDVDALRVGLDNFQQTFSKRLGMLEGFREL